MAYTYFPFDAGAGANVSEAQWRSMARLFRETGVIPDEGDEFEVTESSPAAMSVDVGAGVAWVRGHFFESDAEVVKTLSTADPTNPRIDRIIIRADFGNNTISVEVLEGTPAATPVAPALTQSASTWEESLARINIDAAAGSIATADIVDERQFSLNDGSSIGDVKHWAGTTAPTGYVLLTGATDLGNISRFTYHRLFALIGTTHGVGDGSTTFTAPPTAGRFLVGVGAHSDINALGDKDGLAVANRRPSHKTSISDPGHAHTFFMEDDAGADPNTVQGTVGGVNELSTITTHAATTGITAGPQTGAEPTDTVPYIAFHIIMRAR